MHLLTNKNPAPLAPGHALKPGTWLLEDQAAAQVMGMAGGGEVECVPYHNDRVKLTVSQKLLIVRPGRFGDLICLTPALRRLKHLHPKTEIHVATMAQYREPLLGLPYIDGFVNYPVAAEELKSFTQVICLEGLVSLAEDEKKTHITDLFAQRLDLDPEDMPNKVPDLFLSLEELTWAADAYPRKKGKKRIGIHVRSSTRSRDYPFPHLNKLMVMLHSAGHEIAFIGLPHQFKWAIKEKPPEGIIICPEDKLTFRQSCAVLSTCDAFFGPDSSMIHAAGALGIPSIGVFSTMPWQLRTKYYPKCHVIQSKTNCPIAPCFSAPLSTDQHGFPVDGPCHKSGHCDALMAIDPARIAKKLEDLLTASA